MPLQRLGVDTPSVHDMDLIIHWRLRHQMAFIFEIAVETVLPLLPAGIHPVEARPDVALLFIGYNDYDPSGNTIQAVEQPRFCEMTRCVLVQPDLGVKMPIPRFTFFVHRIGSNNRAFVEQEIAQLHLPAFHSPSLSARVDEAGTTLELGDDAGPIQRLVNTHPKPTYRKDAFFGQYYTVEDGKLYFGVWSWEGHACVHQRPGDAGRIFEHRFLTGVERRLAADSLGPCYQQLFSRPGDVVQQRFYRPRFVRELR